MILHFFILCLPFLSEALIESHFELVEKKELSHFWTAVIRGVVMLGIAITYNLFGINDGWRVLIMQGALHFMFFNYLYNILTKRKLTYLRAKGIDGLLRNVPSYGVFFWQIIIMIAATMIYYKMEGL
jgi:hypothetical protein